MSRFNTESVEIILDQILKLQNFCLEHPDLYKNDKLKLRNLVDEKFPDFYKKYPQICYTVMSGKNLDPLFDMLNLFGNVQKNNISFDKANELIVNGLNEKYVNPILESDKLKKEREEKQKQ